MKEHTHIQKGDRQRYTDTDIGTADEYDSTQKSVQHPHVGFCTVYNKSKLLYFSPKATNIPRSYQSTVSRLGPTMSSSQQTRAPAY